MGLSARPAFRLLANDKDITAAVQDRFSSLRVTDEAGLQSDLFEIVLADHLLPAIALPPSGAELTLWLGYGDRLARMGLYICDEFELSGWPAQLTIRGRAAPYDGTKQGKTSLQTQKSRSWAKGTRLADMVATIAKEHNLAATTAPALRGIVLTHWDQTEESDISFLVRVAARYDAIVKPANGKLVVAKRGESKTASGLALPVVTIRPGDVGSYNMTMAKRDASGTVVAYWQNKRGAKREQISMGDGEPVRRLRNYYPTQDAAREAAQTEYNKRLRGEHKLTLSMAGRTDLQAEGRLVLTDDFRPGVAGEWLTTRVEHSLDKSAGYSCSVEAEKPNQPENEAENEAD